MEISQRVSTLKDFVPRYKQVRRITRHFLDWSGLDWNSPASSTIGGAGMCT